MSDSKMSLEEDASLADMFSDAGNDTNISIAENDTNISIAGTSDKASSTSADPEPSVNIDDPEWKGVSMEEIYRHHGPFDWHHLTPIHPSSSHTVLFQLPLVNRGPPKPYTAQTANHWSQNYVRMPYSSHSLYPINPENESSGGLRRRWDVIQEALLQNFVSSHQLEVAILSYNHKYAERWNFAALHSFFNDYIDEEEMKMCLGHLVPKIIQLALQLPDLVPGSIPLLRRHSNKSISLSQLQVASLLANAFFCTFPRRNSTNPQSEYALFPHINFNRLFGALHDKRASRRQAVMEKLKCIFHYFRRVTSKEPEGTITIQRRYIPKNNCPNWDNQNVRLPQLHITSKGTIESEGLGLLQVDFANKFVGGGVLRYGCVQEEIRFVLCPELMVTMLVTESLDDTEALVIKGVERYSLYEGYGDHFTWAGNYIDETPRDNSGRMKTCIVAMDAQRFNQPKTQYNTENLIRELNKAYVGFFSEIASDNLPGVATGNWGCGAFSGNPQLKVLIQLMAAAVTGRSITYFTFGDENLRDSVAEMYWNLIKQDMNVGRLFVLMSEYQDIPTKKRQDFYSFLYTRSKMKPLEMYFNEEKKNNFVKKISPKKNKSTNQILQKSPEAKSQFNNDFKKYASIAKLKENQLEEKIEKWLEDVEDDNGVAGLGSNQIENKEKVDGKQNVNMPITNDGNESQQLDSVSGDCKETSTPLKKKKQSFAELFGEKYDDPPKKRISSLDTFDQLILEEATKKQSKSEEPMEVDISVVEKNSDQNFINRTSSPITNKSIKNSKKGTQMKIHDFFKKKDT
ncbi:poly(ADP-ribose) glycohydrolase-like [Copidosoma floridanum]|uniref:poly(ADP-ribose) glycohydrolase-like n=1 Tax=Copidosoma floridanum TaxID=29053 RepID=UPI0006C99F9C|nr:poly(ADP-ribose) glycohydrolase-like [Copidosoma floridanum]